MFIFDIEPVYRTELFENFLNYYSIMFVFLFFADNLLFVLSNMLTIQYNKSKMLVAGACVRSIESERIENLNLYCCIFLALKIIFNFILKTFMARFNDLVKKDSIFSCLH